MAIQLSHIIQLVLWHECLVHCPKYRGSIRNKVEIQRIPYKIAVKLAETQIFTV